MIQDKINDVFLNFKKADILVLCPLIDQKYYSIQKNNQIYFASCLSDCLNGVNFSLEKWPFKNKSFDLIVIHNHIAQVRCLFSFLGEINKKLSDKGQVLIIEANFPGDLSDHFRMLPSLIKSTHSPSMNNIIRKFNQFPFIKGNHCVFNKNGSRSLLIYIKWLVPFFLRGYFLHYHKETIPVTPIKFKVPEKLLSQAKNYVPASHYEITIKGKNERN